VRSAHAAEMLELLGDRESYKVLQGSLFDPAVFSSRREVWRSLRGVLGDRKHLAAAIVAPPQKI
jgi:hypothetical protein